jgi:hypothetical protein
MDMSAARWHEPFDDRRHAQRVDTEGTALVHLHHRTLCARIADVSTSGVRLRLARGLELASLADARVVVELRLDGARNGWLRFPGTVQRVDGAAYEVVVAFDAVPADFEDVIQDELVAALEGDRSHFVLLVDADPHRRSALARAFSTAGCRVAETCAPLEALSALDESKTHFSLIAIADTSPAIIGEEFRRFIAAVHPELTHLSMRMPRSRQARKRDS